MSYDFQNLVKLWTDRTILKLVISKTFSLVYISTPILQTVAARFGKIMRPIFAYFLQKNGFDGKL